MRKAAVQLGVDTQPGADTDNAVFDTLSGQGRHVSMDGARKDYFIERGGRLYAGTHLIVDLWGAQRLDDLDHVEAALRDCVDAAGATLLHIHLHHFSPNNGISGVAVLAESHVSVHTWPEIDFAAFDVFMCGDTEPHKAVEVLRRAFRPDRIEVGEHLRGRME